MMDLGLGFDLSSVSWKFVLGGVLAMAGLGVAVLAVGAANGTKFMKVDDGEEPDQYYRRWKSASLGKKLSRGGWFLVCFAIGLVLGGCGIVSLEVLR